MGNKRILHFDDGKITLMLDADRAVSDAAGVVIKELLRHYGKILLKKYAKVLLYKIIRKSII